jgi:hypothetical protein
LKHKQTLRSWLKPKCGKAQRSDLADVYQINYLSAVNRIAGETVRVPRQNSLGFAQANPVQHFAEHSSARFFGSLPFRSGSRQSFGQARRGGRKWGVGGIPPAEPSQFRSDIFKQTPPSFTFSEIERCCLGASRLDMVFFRNFEGIFMLFLFC